MYIACGLRALRMSLVSGSLRGIEGGIDINVYGARMGILWGIVIVTDRGIV